MIMVSELDIQHFRININKQLKDKQLNKFSKIPKATKIEYQKIPMKNKDLKNYILQHQHQQQKQHKLVRKL